MSGRSRAVKDEVQPRGAAEELVAAWARFIDILGSGDALTVIGTEEAVEALLVRSSIENLVEQGADLDRKVLDSLDEQFRKLEHVLVKTRVALYRDAEPAAHWWWRAGEPAEAAHEPFSDVAAIAARKAVHTNTVRAAIHSGELPARRVGRTFLVASRDVDNWEPRGVGRPSQALRAVDSLLAEFNKANEAGLVEAAHEVAARLAIEASSGARCLAVAIDSYNRGLHSESLVWLDRARELGLDRERLAKAALVRGLALIQLQQPKEAVAELRDVPAPSSLRWRFSAALADALLAANEPDEAEVVVDAGMMDQPDAAELRYVAARIRFHHERPGSALEHIVAFRTTKPDDIAGLLLHGSILGRLADLAQEDGLYRDAKELFERALAAGDPRGHAKLALTCARTGDWQESLDHVAAIRDVARPDLIDQLVRAALFGATDHGGMKEAFAAAEEAEARMSSTPLTRIFAAMAYGSRGQNRQGLKLLERDLSKGIPERPEIDCWAGIAYLSLGDAQSALNRLQRFAGTPGRPEFAYVLWGQAAAAAGDIDQALSALSNLKDRDSSLGRLADLSLEIIDQQGRARWRPARLFREIAGHVRLGGLSGFLDPTWDLEHRDVSVISERGLLTAGP
jgi:excisionase family DNA binding protein